MRKIILLMFAMSFATYSFGQKILLNEDFKDNVNKWKTGTTEYGEKMVIEGGRYNLNNPTSDRYSASVIATKFSGESDFVIESTVTKLPREKEYQKIDVQKALELLPNMRYTNKSERKVLEGLRFIDEQQMVGVRYNFNISGTYEWHYSKITPSKQQKEALSFALGFIKSNANQLLYNDEMYGVIWGGQDDNGYFVFLIQPNTKRYGVASVISGNLTSIINFQESNFINDGIATNKLSVTKIDDELIFYINNKKVNIANNQQFHGTNIGFFVGPECNISVDNLVLAIKNDDVKPVNNEANNSFKSSGTGFLISNKGYIVTNNHVIDGASEIWIELPLNGKLESVKARVALLDKNNDLAILKLDGIGKLPDPSFGFRPQTIDVGSNVFTMGYPLLSVLGDELKITDGIISSKTGYKGDISTYQISAPIQPGNSGGALFDKKGNLVGITNAGIPDAQNVGYAIKASYLQNLIELLSEKVELPVTSKVENLHFTEQVKELKKFVVIVKVK